MQNGRHIALSIFRLDNLGTRNLHSIDEDLTLLSFTLPFGHSFRNPYIIHLFRVLFQSPFFEFPGVLCLAGFLLAAKLGRREANTSVPFAPRVLSFHAAHQFSQSFAIVDINSLDLVFQKFPLLTSHSELENIRRL